MTKYPGSRPANENVITVLSILDDHMKDLEREAPEEQIANRTYARWNKWAFGLLGLDLILSGYQAAAAYKLVKPFEYFEVAYAVLFLGAIAISITANIRQYRSQGHLFKALKQPRQTMIASLKNRLKLEDDRVAELLCQTTATLMFTRARLTQASDVNKERSEATFGAASKLGLFPGILAAGAALIPLVKGGPLWAQALAVVVTFLIILNQNTATTLQMALADTKLMLGLLDRAIAIKEEDDQRVAVAPQPETAHA